jgi:hypothetical protein
LRYRAAVILASALSIGIVAVAVVVPLVREYLEFRREWRLSRVGALLAAGTLFPSLGIGLAASLPLVGNPALQWAAAVAVTIAVYSLATGALRPALASAATRRPS